MIICVVACLAMMAGAAQAQKKYSLSSPGGKLVVAVTAGDKLSWNLSYNGEAVLEGEAAMTLSDGSFGKDVKVKSVKKASVSSSFATAIYKKSEVQDEYNSLTLICRGGYSVEFRAYDEAAAYRFISDKTGGYIIENETAGFSFSDDYRAFVPYVNDNRSGERYCYSFESYYDEQMLSELYPDSLAITPLAVCLPGELKATIMEGGLEDYPGMFLRKGEGNSLIAEFAPYPLESIVAGHARLNLIPTMRAEYIAKVDSPRSFPWRVVLVTEKDTQLADNDMAQRLAPACKIDDLSWIKPGKVAWDWWNTCNLTGVDFESGMNTPTYKAFIDFAAANGLEYIIIDEGWSGKESLLKDLNPEIDLPEIVSYGNEKGVGVILWSSWRNAADELEEAFSHYEQLGIKGFKIDFFDRDDQPLIKSVEEIAAAAAEHHLLLDLHGLKPYGIQRTYPNILNFEGVKGLENAKWEPIVDGEPFHDFPRYDVTIPYLRMLPGPLDYTPGAMMNATKDHFRTDNDHPMSQGTRVHQMAMYTVYEAPLQMLADSPSKYMKEQECTDFIASIPTTFDETIAIDGQMGEYIVIARRKGDTWYVGALTNWTAREISIDLSFLGEGSHEAVIFSDGVNAHKEATDYKRSTATVSYADSLNIRMAPGGGWAAIIK